MHLRRWLLGLVGLSMFCIGPCLQEDVLSLSKRELVLAYGDSAVAVGCQFRTWYDRHTWLPVCYRRF